MSILILYVWMVILIAYIQMHVTYCTNKSNTYLHIKVHTYTSTWICVHILHTSAHTCIYTHTHTHTHSLLALQEPSTSGRATAGHTCRQRKATTPEAAGLRGAAAAQVGQRSCCCPGRPELLARMLDGGGLQHPHVLRNTSIGLIVWCQVLEIAGRPLFVQACALRCPWALYGNLPRLCAPDKQWGTRTWQAFQAGVFSTVPFLHIPTYNV